MNIRSILIFFFIVAIIIFSMSESSLIEGMRGKRSKLGRGRQGRRGKRGSSGWFGRGYFRHRAPVIRKKRHNWRRGGSTSIYDGVPYYWGGWRPISPPNIYNYYPSWIYSGQCRRGCGYLGNGVVGCLNPSNLPDSCIFASDCYGC